jgi:nicotinate-nucleotide pyrophosphorylase (carboxylating)
LNKGGFIVYLNPHTVDSMIEIALAEDLGSGDITTDHIFSFEQTGAARIVSRQPGIIAGLPLATAVFQKLDPDLNCRQLIADGEAVDAGTILAEISGRIRPMLSGERTALNFLQQLSAIATKTAAFVNKVAPYKVKIIDTRKTIPGLRALSKYAVRMGGGFNHRFGLYDAAMIKDNHIQAAGSIATAVLMLKKNLPVTTQIEVEAETLAEVKEALEAGADIIMLDNMDPDRIREAVRLVEGKTLLEASGGITLASVEEIAKTGVDLISVGELTHSIKALDISMDWSA